MKRIKVRGHYRMIPDHTTARIVVDPDNPAHETYIVKMKKVWVKPYEKLVK